MKFEDIRFYDRDFNILLIVPRYISANWEMKFCGYGNGEFQLEKTEDIVRLLTENKYLFLVQGNTQSVVTGYKIADVCTVFTRTPEWLLTKFAVEKFSASDVSVPTGEKCSRSALIEYVLKTYLHNDFAVEFCGIDDESDMSEFVQEKVSDVYSVIKEIIVDPNVGFEFYRDFSDGHFIFRMKQAKKNKNLIFCDKYNTSYDSEYNFDLQNEFSGGIFYHSITNMGKWDAQQNIPELTINTDNYGKYYIASNDGRLAGMEIHEGDILICRRTDGIFELTDKAEPYLVKIEPKDEGIFSWTAPLTSRDTVSAEKELSEKKVLDMVNCMTGLSYMEDFYLGDIVKVRFYAEDFYCEQEKIISQIHIWDEADGSGAVPTLTDISQEVENVI